MQMPPRHVVIFARAPRMGRVKTRLAADIGRLAALRFYRDQLRRTLRALGPDPRWTTWLAVTPDADADRRRWPAGAIPPGVIPVGQGRGDLGRRMAAVFRDLPPGPAVIVGSDIPALGPAQVLAAFRALGRNEAVIGPADDGGYWLIGLRRLYPVPAGLFAGVRWSGPQALADTRASLPRSWRLALLEELADIDDGADYRRHLGGAVAPPPFATARG